MKDILTERNELKTRVNDLEDELSQYRPVEQLTESYVKLNTNFLTKLLLKYSALTTFYTERSLVIPLYLNSLFFN